MYSEYHKTLIHKHLSGQASVEEQQALETWLDASPANRQVFEEVQRVWALTASYEADLDIDLAQEKARFKARIAETSAPAPPKFRLMRFAALFVILMGGILVWQIFGNRGPEQIVIETAANETRELQLPDQSTVWLNEQSRLTYDAGFETRHLELTGEAYFDVTRDERRPFEVRSGPGRVRVLGTAFNIRNRENEEKVRVTVAEGLVAVETTDGAVQTQLAAGYLAVLDKAAGTISQQPNDTPGFLNWRSRTLIFEEASMAEVVAALKEHFALAFAQPEGTLANCTFTGQFVNPEFDEVIEALTFSLNLNLVSEDGMYAFSGTGCSPDNL